MSSVHATLCGHDQDKDRKAPDISIVMPAYNAASTISFALFSILKQTHQSFEVIVCDDYSRDNTQYVVEGFKDPRIRLLISESNLGPGLARDKAIREARGSWVALIDADDAWHPERLSRLLDAGTRINSDVLFDDALLCHDGGETLIPWRRIHGHSAFGAHDSFPRQVSIEDYIREDRLLIQPLIRTEFIRKHGIRHSTRRFGEDAEFYLRLGLCGARFCYLPQPLYHYRITPGSLTAQASDPSLMRHCLEECANWDGWQPSAQAAVATKIGSLHRNEAMYALSALLTRGRILEAFRLLRIEPHLLGTLPHKVLGRLHYHAHRMLHGGRKRQVRY